MKRCKMRKPQVSDGVTKFEKMQAMIKDRLYRYRELSNVVIGRPKPADRQYGKARAIEEDLREANVLLRHLQFMAKNYQVPDRELVMRYRELKKLRLPRIASLPQLRAWLAQYRK